MGYLVDIFILSIPLFASVIVIFTGVGITALLCRLNISFNVDIALIMVAVSSVITFFLVLSITHEYRAIEVVEIIRITEKYNTGDDIESRLYLLENMLIEIKQEIQRSR